MCTMTILTLWRILYSIMQPRTDIIGVALSPIEVAKLHVLLPNEITASVGLYEVPEDTEVLLTCDEAQIMREGIGRYLSSLRPVVSHADKVGRLLLSHFSVSLRRTAEASFEQKIRDYEA